MGRGVVDLEKSPSSQILQGRSMIALFLYAILVEGQPSEAVREPQGTESGSVGRMSDEFIEPLDDRDAGAPSSFARCPG
jgi:hypothetical protein